MLTGFLFLFQLPPGEYHDVHTVTDEPSCYMYIFVNTTETELQKNLTAYNKLKEALSIGDDVGKETFGIYNNIWYVEISLLKVDVDLKFKCLSSKACSNAILNL